MSKDLNPNGNTWHDTVTIPSPGEPRNVANSLEGPMQKLLDNLGWLKTKYTELSTSGLADRSVTTGKLADGAVTLAKLANAAKPWEMAWYQAGKPAANTTVAKYVCTRSVRLLTTYAGGAHADVAPSGPITLVLRRNGTQIGTVAWAAGQNVAAVTVAAGVDLVAGDVLSLTTPAAADAALAGVAVTVAGVLT